jgi:hypothetical protein
VLTFCINSMYAWCDCAELTVSEFAECVRSLGTQDALLLGGSGDVNMWVRPGDPSESEPSMNPTQGTAAAVEVEEGHILMARPRANGTRAGLGPGERPLNALVAAYVHAPASKAQYMQ